MSSTQVFRLRDYELVCSSRPVDGGRFEPTLVIARNAWPGRPRIIAVRRGDFPDESDAINSAHLQGIEWIENFG
jgi:hypothetical protein